MEEKQKNRRHHSDAFSYFLVTVLTMIFLAILYAIVAKPELPAQVQSTLNSWGALLLGMVGVAVGFQWGSSRSSQAKDEMAAAHKSLEITNSTAGGTVAAAEPSGETKS